MVYGGGLRCKGYAQEKWARKAALEPVRGPTQIAAARFQACPPSRSRPALPSCSRDLGEGQSWMRARLVWWLPALGGGSLLAALAAARALPPTAAPL